MLTAHGFWQSPNSTPAFAGNDITDVVERIREPMFVVQDPNTSALGVALGGDTQSASGPNGTPGWPLLAVLPPLYPEWLGDRRIERIQRETE